MKITERPRNLTAAEFNTVAKHLNLEPVSLAIAREALVHGVAISLLARKYDKPKYMVHYFTQSVWHKFLEQKSAPKHWQLVRLTLPKNEAEKAIREQDKLKTEQMIEEILSDKSLLEITEE